MRSIRKYSCSGPHVVCTRSALAPKSRRMRTAWLESASIDRSSGSLLVEGFTRPRDERAGDDQRAAVRGLQQPRGAGGIPRRVAAGLEGGAHAARREAGGVGLALDQLAAVELGDGVAVGRGREEAVVLLGRNARHGLEPVRVVRGAVLDGPVLHGGRDRVGGGVIQRFAAVNRTAQGAVDFLWQPRPLDGIVERQAPVDLRRVRRRLRGGTGGHAPVADHFDGFTQRGRPHEPNVLSREAGRLPASLAAGGVMKQRLSTSGDIHAMRIAHSVWHKRSASQRVGTNQHSMHSTRSNHRSSQRCPRRVASPVAGGQPPAPARRRDQRAARHTILPWNHRAMRVVSCAVVRPARATRWRRHAPIPRPGWGPAGTSTPEDCG